jgi:O-antigen/teichoic acid export membrane protein
MPSQQPTLTQRVFSAAAWNTLLFPARFVVGLVANILLLNYLSPAEYGILTLLTGLAATIGVYADLGIERSLPRFLPEIEGQSGRRGVARFLTQIITLKLGIMLLCVVALLLLSDPLIGFATRDAEPEIVTLAQERGQLLVWAVIALVVFGALYDVFMAFLTAYFKQRAWNSITIIIALLQPLLVIGFIALEWGISGVLLGMVITSVVAVALAAWQMLRAGRETPEERAGGTPEGALARRFAGFAGMSYFIQVTTWFYDVQFISFVLVAMNTPLDQMALLVVAYKFAKDYLSYVYIPFSGVLTPLLARIRGRQEPAALQETYAGLTRLFALLLIPAGVGLALLTPRLLSLLYPQYTDAAHLIYIFIAFTFIESLISVPHNVLMVYERYRPVLLSRLLALSSVPLLAIFVLWLGWGLTGAALAVGLARVFSRITTLVYVRRQMGLRFPLAFVGRVTAATLAFGAPLLLLLFTLPPTAAAQGWGDKVVSALGLLGLAAAAGVGYLVALRLLGGLDEQERRRILSLKLPFKGALAKLL